MCVLVQVDGEAGIWFFTMQAIRNGRERKGYFTPTPAFRRRPRSRLTDMCKEAAVAFPQVAGEGVSRPGTGATMPLAAFLEHGDNVRWTAGMDALLVRAVNELCGLKQLCPWNLTTRLLLATVTPVRPDLDALARDAALPRGGSSTILSQDPHRPWPLGSPAAGSYVTDQAILARFAVLRLFNERLVNVLPFVGLGDGLSCVASPTVMASVWQSKSPVPGLGLGEHPRDYRHGSRSFSQGGGKGLGPMLCTLRGSVFTVSKERVLQAAISRTMTVSKKADDDYDYPDDLPQVGHTLAYSPSSQLLLTERRSIFQVLLNRPKALKARKDADPEARLAMSLFAQLFDQLRYWRLVCSNRLMRISGPVRAKLDFFTYLSGTSSRRCYAWGTHTQWTMVSTALSRSSSKAKAWTTMGGLIERRSRRSVRHNQSQ